MSFAELGRESNLLREDRSGISSGPMVACHSHLHPKEPKQSSELQPSKYGLEYSEMRLLYELYL